MPLTSKQHGVDLQPLDAGAYFAARRHPSKSQRAAIAVEMLPHLQAEADARMKAGENQLMLKSAGAEKGSATELAGKQVGGRPNADERKPVTETSRVSTRSVEQAGKQVGVGVRR